MPDKGQGQGQGLAGTISEVKVIPLKKVCNERGHLLEVQRRDDPHFLGFGQAYVTATLPGVVKAWYRHAEQFDQITVLKGALHLVLYDTRPDSATVRVLQHIHLKEDNPQLIQIPPGIWHGFQAVSAEPAVLLHLNTIPFDFAHPDEERLATDAATIPYRWGTQDHHAA